MPSHDPVPGTVTSASMSPPPSDESTEATAALEESLSQDEMSPVAHAVSPATTQPPQHSEMADESDLPPESGH